MKMIKSVLLSIIILLCITAGLDMYVYAVTDGYFEYSFYDENSIEITAYNGNATNLSIPKEIDGYAVKSIGDYAFESCTGLNSVTIPSSVEFINWYAFDNCTGLKTLVISEGVKEICEGAFNGCSSLTNVIIPNSVTLIDIGAFADCSALKSINIPQNVEIIEPYAFRNCSSLSAITVDENNEYYDSRNNCNAIIETDTDILIFGCKNTIIPNTVLE
ncbi:MAG: leucine-rich repeat domain-containing protein, partial [Eubacterium sp.]|nr:leucine-rich repeat domain-containing protein [Eubacterium sp.]